MPNASDSINDAARPVKLAEKDAKRFASKFQEGPESECWNWTAGRNYKGYGIFFHSGRQHMAHRISYEIKNGAIPSGLNTLHRCDNRRCVNPSHLFIGTHADNVSDMILKGRQAKGDRHGSRLHPERRARGIRHGSHTHPEKWGRGATHYMRLRPDTIQKGESLSWSKLTEESVRQMRNLRKDGMTYDEIAKRFGVTRAPATAAIKGKTWKHVR